MFTEQTQTNGLTVAPVKTDDITLLQKINATPNDNKEKLNIILGKVHDQATEEMLEETLRNAKLKFLKVEKIEKAKAEELLGICEEQQKMQAKMSEIQMALQSNSKSEKSTKKKRGKTALAPDEQSYMRVSFENSEDLLSLAHCILFDKTLSVNGRRLYIMLHKQNGNYNAETSIHIGLLNYQCREDDIIEELNLILRDQRLKRQKESGQPQEGSTEKNQRNNFILSCMVAVDPATKLSKRFAFVDFSSKEAAELCMLAWNNNCMKRYPNRLMVTMFDQEHQKLSKSERERTRERLKPAYTNLYVEKLPYQYSERDVIQLFSQYGVVKQVLLKKPQTNVPLTNINSLPCSAYVNFQTEDQAALAVKELNGKCLIPGSNHLRIEPYQRANRFLGGMMGLNRQELISNTHFRVLFIKGLYKETTRDELLKACKKYGQVETLTLKTKIMDQQVRSRGIAIVQYAERAQASEAMKKLPFESNLGELIDVDFYQSKESRMQELEVKKSVPVQQMFGEALVKTLSAMSPKRISNSPSRTNQKSQRQPRHAQPKRASSQSKNQGKREESQGKKKAGKKEQAAVEDAKKQNSQQSDLRKSRSKSRKNKQTNSNGIPKVAQKMEYRRKDERVKTDADKKKEKSEQQPVKYQKKKNAKSATEPDQLHNDLNYLEEFNQLTSDAEKKQFLGNYLYHYVLRKIEKDEQAKDQSVSQDKILNLASKITGMIIEGQTIEFLLYLFNSRQAFEAIVNEAVTLLEKHENHPSDQKK